MRNPSANKKQFKKEDHFLDILKSFADGYKNFFIITK